MKKVIVIALSMLLFQTLSAQNDNSSPGNFIAVFENYIQSMLAKMPGIPSLAVVVIKDDKPIFTRAYGYANVESGIKADINTPYYIASSTKPFTALAAALLDKDGIIKLSDQITRYSKGITFSSPIPERITMRDLLTHTSGLRNGALTFRLAYTGQVERNELINVFAGATSVVDSAYGKYFYDNLGYNVYTLLLQNHTGKKWQDVLQEKIFDPLQIKRTSAYASRAAKWNVALPYIYSGESGKMIRSWLDKTDNNMQSAGGMFSSISDIGAWINMNMNNGKLNGKQVIPAEIIKLCQTGYTTTNRNQPPFTGEGEYGLGWQIGKYKNEKVIYHHGGFPGYRTHISFMPEKKIAVAVLSNDGFLGGFVTDQLAVYAYDWFLQSIDTALYTKQLDQIKAEAAKARAAINAGAADRAKRTSQLTMNPENYTGVYSNSNLGTMQIINRDNTLEVKFGDMNCLSTPFTAKETIRVELIPGSGEVIRFKKNEDGKIISLNYSGVDFLKVR